MYIGGAPLSRHWNNVQGDKAAYSYRKIGTDGVKVTRKEVSILTALQDEQWDYVSLQQASSLSGKVDTYRLPLRALHRYIDSRSEEHTSELQSLMRISYAVFCLKKKTKDRCNT